MKILAVHISTHNMHGVLFNENSDICHEAEVYYQPQYFEKGKVEQNPLEWASALRDICRDCMQFLAGTQESLDAIVYTSQRSSVIPMDQDGKPLRSAIMWEDTRNASYIKALEKDTEQVYDLTGSAPNAVYTGTKMRWIRDNEPELYRLTYKFCTIGDYLNFLMTGEYKTDYTYGSRSLLMNIDRFEWDREMLDLIGVPEDKLCEIVEPGSITGFVTDAFSSATGIPAGIPVISAGGDQQCNALGAGVLEEHATEITVGPGGYIFTSSNSRPSDPACGITCGAHSIPGKYVLECSMINSDDIYRWVNQLLYGKDDVRPKSFVQIDEAVEQTPAGSHGCIAIPYLSGRGTPDWNTNAFGGFLNVTPATTKGDMARSVLEAIACEMTNMLEVLGKWEKLPKEIFLGGYLVHSSVFSQMLADASGITMKRNITPIAQTCFGAFVMASVTLGIYGSYEEAYLRGKQHSRYKTYVPDPDQHALYEGLRAKIGRIYRNLMLE